VPRATRDPLEEQILEALRRAKRKHFQLDRLAASLDRDQSEVSAAIAELVRRGDIVRTRKGRVALASRVGLVVGTLQVARSGRALVIPEEPDAPISIPRGRVRPAMHGDRVLVEAEPYTRRGLRNGTIREILERGADTIIGTVERPGGHQPILAPTDSRVGYLATLTDDGLDAPPGCVVVGRIVEYPTAFREPVVRIEELLGPAGTLATEIESVCRTLGIPVHFGQDAEAEARAFTQPGVEDLRGRTDLRGQLTITIDPHDAKDHDDAVAIERTASGYSLTVSIADVSYYVRPGTALDGEAYERGTSVYFPGRCVPMLPEALSSNLASLRPHEDRLAVSVALEISPSGEVGTIRFMRSVIRSDHRLSYEEVQEILDAPATQADLAGTITTMAECATQLLHRRLERGAIDLDIPEAVISLDADGFPAKIEKRPRLMAHRVIEEFMLAANEAVARELERTGVPFLYRIHERPGADAMMRLADSVRLVGLRMEHEGADVRPKAIQRLATRSRGTPHERLVHMMILRSMTQARYSAHKEIHFGLASAAYCHFTSPIRRYPDLVVHRALCSRIADGSGRLPSAQALESVAEQCSQRERRAMDAERDVQRAAGILYMQKHVGDTFEGTVTSVQRYGFYVELDDVFIEGFVPIGRLSEYYEFVAERLELHSRTSNDVVKTGRRMQIRVQSADLADRRLEFEPITFR